MQKIKKKLMIIILASMASACTVFHQNGKIDPTNLHQLENLSEDSAPTPSSSPCSSNLRYKALEDTAMSLGAQGGLAWASKQIDARLERDKWSLETVYNFNGMMLSHGVLPPVLEEGDNTLNKADCETIRIADKVYKIIKQACFVTTPPNWREYLWLSYPTPEIPHKFLLPRDDDERCIWRKALHTGWMKGIQQASSIFRQNLARLRRDYQGMILYRKLLQMKMVSPPYVSKTMLGVTGDANNMRINDQVLRITEQPKLQTDSRGWKAIVVKSDG